MILEGKKKKKHPQNYLEKGRTYLLTICLHCHECHIMIGVLVRADNALLYWLTWQPQFEYILVWFGERRGFAPERQGRQRWGRFLMDVWGRRKAEEDSMGAVGGWRKTAAGSLEPTVRVCWCRWSLGIGLERGCTLPRPICVALSLFERIRTFFFLSCCYLCNCFSVFVRFLP